MYKARYKNKDVTVFNEKLKVGDKLPNFLLNAPDFSKVTLDMFSGKRKIIYTAPSIETEICNNQTRFLQEKVLGHKDVVEITVSCDLPYALQRWCGYKAVKNSFVLSDYYNLEFARNYGVMIDELHLLHRAVFIADKNNNIIYIEYASDSKNPLNLEKIEEYI